MAFLKLPDDVSECSGINWRRVTEYRARIWEKTALKLKKMLANFVPWDELWSYRALLSYYSDVTIRPISIFSLT
jgi:hypothetical protein